MASGKIAVNKKHVVKLSAEEREQLDAMICAGRRPAQLLMKARVLLKADASPLSRLPEAYIVTVRKVAVSPAGTVVVGTTIRVKHRPVRRCTIAPFGRSHPGSSAFRRSPQDLCRAILGLYENDPFMNRLLIEAGRSVVFFNILCLHAAYEESHRATWPTMRLLQETTEIYGISSARRIHDIVARFVETGYVRSVAAPADRRARILTPTDKMLAPDLDWLAAWYRPLDFMFPDPGYRPPLCRDPAYQNAHRKVDRGMLAYAVRLMADNPAVMFFMGREAGMMILTKLIEHADEGADAVPWRVSFADIGNRFGISRTHVRTTLQEADAAGLVRMSERSVAMTPPLVAVFDRFVADTMAGHDLMFRLAMRDRGGAQDG